MALPFGLANIDRRSRISICGPELAVSGPADSLARVGSMSSNCVRWRAAHHQWKSWRTPFACLLLATNSWPLVKVINHLWLLRALIFRT